MDKSRNPQELFGTPVASSIKQTPPTSKPDIGTQIHLQHHDNPNFCFVRHSTLRKHRQCSREPSAQSRTELWQARLGQSPPQCLDRSRRWLLNPRGGNTTRRSLTVRYHPHHCDRFETSLTFSATDYSRPRNVGTLDKSDSSVGEGLVGAPACGDVMRLHIKVDPATQVISDVRFKTFGCGSAM